MLLATAVLAVLLTSACRKNDGSNLRCVANEEMRDPSRSLQTPAEHGNLGRNDVMTEDIMQNGGKVAKEGLVHYDEGKDKDERHEKHEKE